MQYRITALAVLTMIGGAACSSDDPGPSGTNPPIIESFEAEPTTLAPGEETTLSWRTRLATAIQITDAAGNEIDLEGVPASAGLVRVEPRGSTTYTLLATGAGGEATAEVQIAVEGTPVVELFEAVPSRIRPGEDSVLAWRVKEATHLLIETDGETLVDTKETFTGTLDISPAKTTTYTLTATFGEAETTASATLQVRPVIDAFTMGQEGPVSPGTEIPLQWETRGAQTLTLSNLETTIELSEDAGETTLPAGAEGTFVLTAKSGELVEEAELQIEVIPLPTIASFEAPELVGATEDDPATITLSWEVENADAIRLVATPGDTLELEEASGQLELPLSETTTFTLQVENAVGEDEATRTVTAVAPVRVLSFTAAKEAILPGDTVDLSWEVENASEVLLTRNGEAVELEAGATTYTDAPTKTADYALNVKNAIGEVANAQVQVVVAETLVAATLAASPAAVDTTQELTLSWTATPVIQGAPVLVSLVDDLGGTYDLGAADPYGDSIVITVPTEGLRTFTLTASALGATAVAEVTVMVAQGPSLVLATDPPGLDPTQSEWEVELVWETQNAETMELFELDGSGNKTSLHEVPAAEVAAGSFPVTVTSAKRFAAVAATADGVTGEETYHLTFGEPNVVSFTASETTVTPGSTVTFTWETEYGVVEFGDVRSEDEEVFDAPYLDTATLGATKMSMSDCSGECENYQFSSGFSFPFFGVNHPNIWVNFHGAFSFEYPGNYDLERGWSCIPDNWAAPVSIAPYWSYFDTLDATSGIYVAESTDLTGRKFVVFDWRNMEIWFGNEGNFQTVLWEDGSFEFRYADMLGDDANGMDADIGYVDPDFDDTLNLFCEELVPGGLSNRSWRFFGPPPAEGSAQIEVNATGDYTLCVQGYNDQEACETVTITVTE